jgi:hypothetical protein
MNNTKHLYFGAAVGKELQIVHIDPLATAA